MHLQGELLRRFRESQPLTTAPAGRGRSVSKLLSQAEQRANLRRRKLAQRQARERSRREQEAAAQREGYLTQLARREDETWPRIEALVATKRPRDHDAAVQLLVDSRDLAVKELRGEAAQSRIARLCARHARKPSFIARVERAGLLEEAGAA